MKTGGRGNREPGRVGAGQTALSLEAGPEPSAKELASDVSLWPDTLLPGLARPPRARTQCYFLRDPCSPDGYSNRSRTLLSWSSQALAQTEGWGSCSQACVPPSPLHGLQVLCETRPTGLDQSAAGERFLRTVLETLGRPETLGRAHSGSPLRLLGQDQAPSSQVSLAPPSPPASGAQPGLRWGR